MTYDASSEKRFGDYLELELGEKGEMLCQEVYVVARTIDIHLVDSREKAIAMTKLEESLLWALRALDRYGEKPE